MKTKLSLSLLLAVLLLCPACNVMQTVKGDGNVITQVIDIADYNEIEISSNSTTFNYVQEQDAAPKLTVTVDQNIYDLYEFKTKGSKLVIRPKKSGNLSLRIHPTDFVITTNSTLLKKAEISGGIEFNVNSPLVSNDDLKLELAGSCTANLNESVAVNKLSVDMAGSSTINAQALSIKRFEGETAGSGTFNLGGTAEKASFEIAGNGDVYAFDLLLSEMSCEIAGNGMVETSTKDNLRVSIAGRGTVKYKGDPSIQKDIAGIGNVKKVD